MALSYFDFSTPELEIRGCRELRAPLNSPAAGSPKITGFYTQHLLVAFEDAVGLPGKNLNFEPCTPSSVGGTSHCIPLDS